MWEPSCHGHVALSSRPARAAQTQTPQRPRGRMCRDTSTSVNSPTPYFASMYYATLLLIAGPAGQTAPAPRSWQLRCASSSRCGAETRRRPPANDASRTHASCQMAARSAPHVVQSAGAACRPASARAMLSLVGERDRRRHQAAHDTGKTLSYQFPWTMCAERQCLQGAASNPWCCIATVL